MMHSPAPFERGELSRLSAWLATGAAIGALIAWALTFVWTPRWEAIAQVRPGQLSQGPMQPPVVVEPPARIIERLNSQAFADALKERLGVQGAGGAATARLIDDTLKATLLERASLVVLKVHGYSPDEARRNLEGALKLLADAHEPMYRPTVERLEQQRKEIAADVERVEQERSRLLKLMGEPRAPSRVADQFSENVLVGNLINIRDSELRGLRDRYASLGEMLSPERTYQTGPIDRITVPDRPAFPRKPVHAVGGAIVGAIVGAAFATMSRRRR